MNNANMNPKSEAAHKLCQEAYDGVLEAWQTKSPPDFAQRVQTLKRLRQWVNDNHNQIIEAADKDFNGRSSHETLMTEIMMAHNCIKHTLNHLRGWMRPSQSLYIGPFTR